MSWAIAHEHAMPVEQHFVGQRLSEGLVELDDHFGDALLRCLDAPTVSSKTELSADGGLDTGAVEDLAFDFRGRHCLGAQ